MIIMQGASGSGKTTKANELAAEIDALVYSTDDFHMEDDKYIFKPSKLSEYHAANQRRTREAIKSGKSVIIDNTNINNWQAKIYVKIALEFGITPEFVRCEGKFANLHGVPEDKVEDMRKNLEELTVEKCLDSKAPWEK